MISRYSRKPLERSLQIRGVSRSSLDQHPLPEQPEPEQEEPPLSHCSRSGCPVDSARSWSGIHSYTGTGVSTERSSLFSWGYDEFDKAASRQVQLMFEEIDEELYEGKGEVQLRNLQEECQQWASRFPHLRIIGKQLICPTDEGFQWFASSSLSSTSISQAQDRTASELCVQGHRAILCPSVELTLSDPPRGSHGDELPRVIEAEGLMEEYLAFDCRDLDEEFERECVSRRRSCLPPISPYRCRREAVLELLFDDVWRELIGWMEELIRRLWEGCVSDEEKSAVALSPARPHSHSPFGMLTILPAAPPRLGPTPSRPQHIHTNLQLQHTHTALQLQSTKSRGSKHKSRRKSKKQRKPSTSSRVPVGTAATHHNLNDLIMIHGIPLQQRNTGVLERAAHDGEERMVLRPGSSIIPSNKPRPRRALEQQSSTSLPRPPQSARRRALPPRTLLPLATGLTPSSPAGNMDEGIRGTRLSTAGDCLSSPPMPLSRNTLLPPIGTADTEHAPSAHHTRHSQRQRGSSSRAHSAVADEAGSLLPRDRLHPQDVYSRPNTTHTFRSDTPYRRSFTVLDSSGQNRPGRPSVGTDSLGIGVTGVSLGISSSSFLDSFTHHPLGHSPVEDEEEPDTQAPPPALLHPVRSHSRGGLMTRSSRPGL
ncbi:protein FAM149B1 isoform X2 [Pygocentrus nattereri]|uniref:protein FAM149B1 isoform X2 n=1 Tax=Pygocentrus nattereri TaxID=42514 RepID=UPI001891E63A|nr:protein FAM149B1 isoform X2 [Pygocentrus nattereri]